MKTITKSTVVVFIYLFTLTIANAQLVNFPSSVGNNYSQTDDNKDVEAIVVGDFNGAIQDPRAALNVNTNFLGGLVAQPPSYGSFGEVLRTDAPDRQDNVDIFSFWRLYTGSQTNEVEHLAIFNSHSWGIVPTYFNDINFRASSGNMFFWTQNSTDASFKRMMINNTVPTTLNINGVIKSLI